MEDNDRERSHSLLNGNDENEHLHNQCMYVQFASVTNIIL